MNQPRINPYQKQMNQQFKAKTDKGPKADQLQISDQAKEMQETQGVHPARSEHVEAIKEQVDTGNYTINPEQVAEKMLNFGKQ
ncbi:flagellar biosynthesis anti-sigma factor FlgM [Pelagirhabdus alkalitolerans]|nr:flagellar biosynthesis anti-sigma factor FlgM [Pelagirhabdus alkalitolerans]